MSEYDQVARGALKLKVDAGIKKLVFLWASYSLSFVHVVLYFNDVLRKKKKDKDRGRKFLEQVNKSIEQEKVPRAANYKMTPAEQAFLKQQEKLVG